MSQSALLQEVKEEQSFVPRLRFKEEDKIFATLPKIPEKIVLPTYWLPFLPSRCCPFREFSYLGGCRRH